MRFYINRAIVHGPHGGGNLWVKAAYQNISAMKQHEMLSPGDFRARPDVIFLAGLDSDGTAISAEQAIMYKMYMGNVKLIARINENDARKGTDYVDDNMLKLSEYVDGAVFVSNWLHDHFVSRGWKCQNNIVVYNGVDPNVFKSNVKIDNGKVNLLMSHWSDNYLKGQDYAEWIDEFVGKHPDKYSFTYIGRTKANFKNSSLIPPMFGEALGKELGKYDVCINASRFDPGPNSVIEPIACGLPTYVHKDGGGAVEFAGTDHVFSTFDELEALLLGNKFVANSTHFDDWNICVDQYVKFAESL
jgi:hypothetical protein